jgi:hypothetical protein
MTLSLDDLAIIKNILEEELQHRPSACVTRDHIFCRMKRRATLPRDMEAYRFKRLLTEAIKDGRILGFETKPGRNGGIRKTQGKKYDTAFEAGVLQDIEHQLHPLRQLGVDENMRCTLRNSITDYIVNRFGR